MDKEEIEEIGETEQNNDNDEIPQQHHTIRRQLKSGSDWNIRPYLAMGLTFFIVFCCCILVVYDGGNCTADFIRACDWISDQSDYEVF